jgi:diguanylate cyclase (GGDEF)-like protein
VTSISQHSASGPSILIVDDSKVVRLSLTKILGGDYHLFEANDGEEAWEILNREPSIKTVFSDLSMPKLDGLGLLKRIRESSNEQISHIPFIIVTGNDNDLESRKQILNQGANDLISKPFDAEEVEQLALEHTNPQQTTEQTQNSEPLISGAITIPQFIERLRRELFYAKRNKNELALMLLQLDEFDLIKRNYSLPAIEHILHTLVEIFRSHSRFEENLAYFEEGRFALVLPQTNAISTKYLGKRIASDLLAKKFTLGDSDSIVTCSIGISAPEIKSNTSTDDLLGPAEQRLQAAIQAGGQTIVASGTANLTPISTLLTEELGKPTREMGNRQDPLNTSFSAAGRKQASNPVDGLQDKLQSLEQENLSLRNRLEQTEALQNENNQLKHKLHDLDTKYQLAEQAVHELSAKNELLNRQVIEAEQSRNKLLESVNDRSVVEQHLVEENKHLQKQFNESRRQHQLVLNAVRKSEVAISSLKRQLTEEREAVNLLKAAERAPVQKPEAARPDEAGSGRASTSNSDNPYSLTTITTEPEVWMGNDSPSNTQSSGVQPSNPEPKVEKPEIIYIQSPAEPEPEKGFPVWKTMIGILAVAAVAAWILINTLSEDLQAETVSQPSAVEQKPIATAASNTVKPAISPDPRPESRSPSGGPVEPADLDQAKSKATQELRKAAEEEFQALRQSL